MAKLTLDTVSAFTTETLTTINNNSAAIEVAMENTFSRDGTSPNQMAADLDLNHNDIINVDNLNVSGSFVLDGETVFPETVVVTNGLLKDNNLSDVSSISAARTNLDVYSKEQALGVANNLSDVANSQTSLYNLASHSQYFLLGDSNHGSGDRNAYIDLHADDTNPISTRIMRDAGVNGNLEITNSGTGDIAIAGNGDLTFNGTSIIGGGDASEITYTQGATGSIQRDLIKIIQEAPLNVCDFGAVGDNSTDNATAFAAVQAALGPNGGEIFVPYGQYRTSGPLLDLTNRRGIKIRGLGTVIGSNPPYASQIIYTASTGPFIRFDSVQGSEICDLDLGYTSLPATERFIDLRKVSGGQYTSGIDIHHCRLGGIGTFNLASPGVGSLVDVSDTIMTSIRYSFLQNAHAGVQGATTGHVSNKIDIIGCEFNGHLTDPVIAGGNGWNIKDCISEYPHPNDNTNAGFLSFTALSVNGFNFSGNQLDDAGTGGTWIDCTSGSIFGGSITGNFLQGGAGHVDINLGSSDGVLISGNWFANGRILGGSAGTCFIVANHNGAGSDIFGSSTSNFPGGHSFIDPIDVSLRSKGSLSTY